MLGGDTTIAAHIKRLKTKLQELHNSGPAVQAGPTDFLLHDLRPGDKIHVKNVKCTRSTETAYDRPFQVLMSMPTAIKIRERDSWIHCSHVKQIPSIDNE